MPPNLGGFFMVRSYYPSECHADYFDFERIEALKPAIEACGISTLRSEERFSRNAETDLVCRLLLETKKNRATWTGSSVPTTTASRSAGTSWLTARGGRAAASLRAGPIPSVPSPVTTLVPAIIPFPT